MADIVERLLGAKGVIPRRGLDAVLDDGAAEIERLRAALRPFADYAEKLEGVNWVPDLCPVAAAPGSRERYVTVGDIRAARAALSSQQ